MLRALSILILHPIDKEDPDSVAPSRVSVSFSTKGLEHQSLPFTIRFDSSTRNI